MRKIETGQLQFGIGPKDSLIPVVGSEEPVVPEQEFRVGSIITFSQLERIIYQEIAKVQPKNFFDASLAIGTAIDHFLVPANFIYRFRDNYCFEEELYPEWDLKTIFERFYPTGWNFGKFLDLLQKHRPNFQKVLKPANSALERKNIKRALIPLWTDIAKEFKLDSSYLQSVMKEEDSFLLPSGQTASRQTLIQIGQRIVQERFDVLVDDDRDYTYCAKPDCLLIYEFDGVTFHILVQPDYIKRLRERQKTTKARNIVTKRIVGDFKDSDRRDLADFTTPFGQSMLVYNWLLLQIGARFRWNQLDVVRLPNRQKRRVFLIPPEISKPVPAGSVQTALEFLQEEGKQIFFPMPRLNEHSESLAKSIFEKALRISRLVAHH